MGRWVPFLGLFYSVSFLLKCEYFQGLHCQDPKQPVHLPVPNATGKRLAFWVCRREVRKALLPLCWTVAPVQTDGLATLLDATLLGYNSLAFTGVSGRLMDTLEEQVGWLEPRGSTSWSVELVEGSSQGLSMLCTCQAGSPKQPTSEGWWVSAGCHFYLPLRAFVCFLLRISVLTSC